MTTSGVPFGMTLRPTRSRLSRRTPYSRDRLPPFETETRATILEDHPLLPECNTLTMHNVSFVRGLPCSVGFTLIQEWVVPWDMVLTREELIILRKCMHVCLCCANIDIMTSVMIHGYESWALHCHCSSPGSLQCIAGGQVLASWFRMVVDGAMFNQRFIWYREVVNYNMPKEVMFMSSVFMRGRHLIYLRLWYDGHVGSVVPAMSFGYSALHCGILNNIVVLCCSYCADLSEIRVRCCARRTRRLMLRAVRIIAEETTAMLYSCRTERRRQQFIRALLQHHRPILMHDYDSTPM
ncbi:E4 control protein 34 kDa [Human mastadenovirus C]|uniref:Control protein E4 34K n=2 Tax=Human mastadenovirus C TaxID=129951 RepID=T1UHK2_9ADEN|nr:E4 control protein 34 kDa [Human mastadenovirus C]WOZ23895.1 E4 34K [Human adenovirus 89]BAU36622.1 E4 control protein 34 kDa [Human adenovirus 6]QDO15260.1 control protein E4 34K [Human mastadenovirus C]QDO15640.1 control protein E4 34K [Human mastadenovirus C]